jgi:acetyltransferase-like isoleucine patch superfamily enzyme
MILMAREMLRDLVIKLRNAYLRLFWKYAVHPSARISFSAFMDRTYPQNISVGEYSIVTRGVVIMSHDFSRGGEALKTIIGKNCLIGVNAIILPGVEIGDEVVVGAGSVVTRSIPSNSLAVGNPAKVIRRIKTGEYGMILEEHGVDYQGLSGA